MTDVQHVIVMGVSGCGKSSVAESMASTLGWPLAEADDLHPAANIEKMSHGIPLTDEDRWPWLEILRDWMTAHAKAGQSTVVTCSALKVAYRDVLRQAEGNVRFVFLNGSRELISARLNSRSDHFMPSTLLDSQFAALEPLLPTEVGVVIGIEHEIDGIASEALLALGLLGNSHHSG